MQALASPTAGGSASLGVGASMPALPGQTAANKLAEGVLMALEAVGASSRTVVQVVDLLQGMERAAWRQFKRVTYPMVGGCATGGAWVCLLWCAWEVKAAHACTVVVNKAAANQLVLCSQTRPLPSCSPSPACHPSMQLCEAHARRASQPDLLPVLLAQAFPGVRELQLGQEGR